MNLNQVKYYTKEDALAAVRKNGTLLESVSAQLKDDYEIVKTAIENGGTLYSASHRLRNDASLVALELKRQITNYFDPHCCDFVETVFAAKNDRDLLNLYRKKYADWEEFNLEMKLFYGDDYDCPISAYNELSRDTLEEALVSCRKHLVESCLEVYKKTRKGPYSHESIKRNKKLSQTIRHRTLRWGITSWEKVEKPATYIVDMLETENNRIKKWISETADKTGGSYPERFMNAVLESMHIEFYREQVFPWSKGKRYDFYIPGMNAIIEVHGAQHYEGGFEYFGGHNLEQERENDSQKEQAAKKNGILNYIVVNAMSSAFAYLKNSLCSNADFGKLFNLHTIDWKNVESLMDEMQRPLPMPLYEAKIEYNELLIKLLKEDIRTHSRAMAFTKETSLMKFFRNCTPSYNGLLPHEILLLEKISTFQGNQIPEHIANKWKTYFQEEMSTQIERFEAHGLVCFADVSKKLDKVNVPILKKVLSDLGFETKGKKEEIILRTQECLSVAEMNALIPVKFYELTEKGKQELADNDYLFNFHGITLKSRIRIVNAYPNVDYKYLFEDVYKHPRRYAQHLEKEDKLSFGIK